MPCGAAFAQELHGRSCVGIIPILGPSQAEEGHRGITHTAEEPSMTTLPAGAGICSKEQGWGEGI